jgi:hypothetical protein
MLWVAITCGRFIGLKDQISAESKGTLYNHLYCWLITGAVGASSSASSLRAVCVRLRPR